jgi:hypothetical protein
MDAGVPVDEAECWCATWEAVAEREGVVRGPYYWDAGRGWIDAQLASSRDPWVATFVSAAAIGNGRPPLAGN